MRGEFSRQETEQELKTRGLVDGRFIVREKDLRADSVQFVISYTYLKKFYHHMLNKKGKDSDFTLNDSTTRPRPRTGFVAAATPHFTLCLLRLLAVNTGH